MKTRNPEFNIFRWQGSASSHWREAMVVSKTFSESDYWYCLLFSGRPKRIYEDIRGYFTFTDDYFL